MSECIRYMTIDISPSFRHAHIYALMRMTNQQCKYYPKKKYICINNKNERNRKTQLNKHTQTFGWVVLVALVGAVFGNSFRGWR